MTPSPPIRAARASLVIVFLASAALAFAACSRSFSPSRSISATRTLVPGHGRSSAALAGSSARPELSAAPRTALQPTVTS
jgi:hypothetical protein